LDGIARIGELTGATTTGTVVDSPLEVVTGTLAFAATGSVAGTSKVGVETSAVGVTLAGTVNPGSETVTVAPKNPPLILTGGT